MRFPRPRPRPAGTPIFAEQHGPSMCLALVALDVHPRFPLVVAANRDEHHARPAAPARWWDEGWLAGRDLTAGGTWLGVTRAGRFAFVTNVREPGRRDVEAPSRGTLVTRALAARATPLATVELALQGGDAFNGFNLIAGDAGTAAWGSNRSHAAVLLGTGVHGLSNAALDTAWPKVTRTRSAVLAWCEAGSDDAEALLGVLADRTRADDAKLPATGVPLEWERLLSAPFIVGDGHGYGTRCSTVLWFDRTGGARFIERSFDPMGCPTGTVDVRFALDRATGATGGTLQRG
jgi:uncharacterized protein with NRDE domain